MLKFPCNHCCLLQYYEFKNIINEYHRKDEIIIYNCCLVLLFLITFTSSAINNPFILIHDKKI